MNDNWDVSRTVLKKLGYSFKNNYINLNGRSCHYIEEGDGGEPVVLLHGNPSWSFYYRHLIHALAKTHHVYAIDHIGCGLSEKPPSQEYDYTLKQRVDDLTAFMELKHLNKDVTLIMHDWGGMIGMAYAVDHPQEMKRLVLMNTAAFKLPAQKSLPWALKFARSKFGIFLILQGNLFAEAAAWIGCKRKRMNKQLRDAYCFPYDSPANRVATAAFVKDIPLYPSDVSYHLVNETEMKLSRLADVPMQICWGGKDFVFDYHFLSAWKQYFPNARVAVFDDCGHYILEDATYEVIDTINLFLQET